MTRDEIFDQYEITNLVIQSPGKFESEAAWAPYFWDVTMDGTCDEITIGDDTVYVVEISNEDRAMWPELDANKTLALLQESDQGFVSCTLATQEEHDKLQAEADEFFGEEDETEED